MHGEGDHGLVPRLIAIARERGYSAYVGDGTNRWPAVHRWDAARLFRLGLEDAPVGTRLHAVADEDIAFRRIAEAIGAGLGVPVRGIGADEAPAHFGFLSFVVVPDIPASSTMTRALTGWEPAHPDLLTDLGAGHYFGR